jgi:hypothetical protein
MRTLSARLAARIALLAGAIVATASEVEQVSGYLLPPGTHRARFPHDPSPRSPGPTNGCTSITR